MSHMLFYGLFKFLLDNHMFSNIYVFQKRHFLLQGIVVFFTVITTILSCKWQSLQLEKIKVFFFKNGNSNK